MFSIHEKWRTISALAPSVRRWQGAVIVLRFFCSMHYMFGNSLPFIYFYFLIYFSGRKEYLHPQ